MKLSIAKKNHRKMWILISEDKPRFVDTAKKVALQKMNLSSFPESDYFMCEVYGKHYCEGCPFTERYIKFGCENNESPYSILKNKKNISKEKWKELCLEISKMYKEMK